MYERFAKLQSRLTVRLSRLALLAVGVCASQGCTSISSRMLTRDATNTHWEQEAHLHGIPITLKVPTHLKVYIYDKHYLEFVNDDQNEVQPVNLDVPVRDFASEFMYTDKIFTVDFKRPAAGSYNLRLAMNDEQYFSQIQHDVTDNTIQDVTTLLGSILGAPTGGLPTLSGAATGAAAPPAVSELKSLVAVGVFEIADPHFQQRVLEFVNCHLNKSHDAWVAAPGVNSINRIGILPGDNLQTPYPAAPFCPGGDCRCAPAPAAAPNGIAPVPVEPGLDQAKASGKKWFSFF